MKQARQPNGPAWISDVWCLPIAGSVYPAIPSIVLVIALSSGPFFAHLVTGLEPSSIFERKQAVDASDRILGYILLHSVNTDTIASTSQTPILRRLVMHDSDIDKVFASEPDNATWMSIPSAT
ncbi:uncharacterized protein B0T23DRAFT_402076 [Neurospora hispaniola]|uniref:Uncharacterized protein n=1 Tax=Neurospora hispaniola TaxID=588809 RepID=A0AAJ0IBX0_9PEZI|nr:hypothetical protein B0T23DRAFT_402076 [Neurospora hispaniola]